MRHMNMVGLAVLMVAIGGLDPGFANARPASKPQEFGVGAQYGCARTHVYVAVEDMDRFSASFLATFGGSSSSPADVTVTPTPSVARWQALKTPVGLVSLFGFKTPMPYPFGQERTGYLVTDMDAAVDAARKDGAAVLVAPFPDAIGRDVIVQWPEPASTCAASIGTPKASSAPLLQSVP